MSVSSLNIVPALTVSFGRHLLIAVFMDYLFYRTLACGYIHVQKNKHFLPYKPCVSWRIPKRLRDATRQARLRKKKKRLRRGRGVGRAGRRRAWAADLAEMTSYAEGGGAPAVAACAGEQIFSASWRIPPPPLGIFSPLKDAHGRARSISRICVNMHINIAPRRVTIDIFCSWRKACRAMNRH